MTLPMKRPIVKIDGILWVIMALGKNFTIFSWKSGVEMQRRKYSFVPITSLLGDSGYVGSLYQHVSRFLSSDEGTERSQPWLGGNTVSTSRVNVDRCLLFRLQHDSGMISMICFSLQKWRGGSQMGSLPEPLGTLYVGSKCLRGARITMRSC